MMKGQAVEYDYADPEAVALTQGGYRLYVGGGGAHQIVSFFSTDGINWTREEGVRVSDAAFPDAVLLPDDRIRLYFQQFSHEYRTGVIKSAISNDGGLTFTLEQGVRVPPRWHGELDPDGVGSPSTIRLPDGRFRMYYIGGKKDVAYGNSKKLVFLSAVSEDGLVFIPDKGTRIIPEDWLGSTLPKFGPMGQLIWSYIDGPEAVLAPDGLLKLYFWGGCNGICLSVSRDGLSFEKVGEIFSNSQLPVKGNAGDPAILQLKDGAWLLFYNSMLNSHRSIFIARQRTTGVSSPTPVPTPPRSPPATPQAELSFEVTVDAGIRLYDAGIPFVLKLRDGRFRVYYCGHGGILSAISSDGLAFTKESGIRISPIGPLGNNESVVCDPTVVELPNGKFRMYYKGGTGGSGPGQSIHKIFSAISSDGLTFQREGLVIDSAEQDNGFASVPEATLLSDGRVRIYFVSDGSYVGHGTVSAISSDGIRFTREATKVTAFVDPAITTLPDGRFMLVAPAIPVLPKGITSSVPAGIYALISPDGINFGLPKTILSDGKIWIDPTLVKIGTDTYRVYYWNPNEQPPQIHSLTLRLK